MKPWEHDILVSVADNTANDNEIQLYRKIHAQDERVELYVELLRATRKRLRRATKAYYAPHPPDLYQRIAQKVEGVRKRNVIFLTHPRWWIAAAAVAAGIVLFALQEWRVGSVNFYDESLHNFELIVEGKLPVAQYTNNFDELSRFFRSHGVQYSIVNIPIKAELIGGVVSEHNGVKLAHIVYQRDNTFIYMYQAPEKLFQQGILTIPKHVEPYAKSGEWYAENVDSKSWFFWRVQSVYCSVVANASKEVIANYFVETAL